ncbi:hypothetical protein [Luteimonas sp. TWI1416]|uniref:hypothetical protein n=1 Tax=unclassified Luteimonas TaxID=2629088 RepID=UPI00320AA277
MADLVSTVVGGALVLTATFVMEKTKRFWAKKENSGHLGVVVLIQLERLIADCAAVVGDDGTSSGQMFRDGNGEEYYMPQVKLPTFELGGLGVEWRSISPSLMYEIHAIPLALDEAKAYLDFYSDHDFPPYADYMFERQLKFASLGIQILGTTERLRSETKIPARPARDWTPESYLLERHKSLTEQQEASQAAQAQSWKELSELVERRNLAQSDTPV